MIIEIGHFYMSESVYDVSYLHNVKKYFPKDYTPVLFIDDIHGDGVVLDLSSLVSECSKILDKTVQVAYESHMIDEVENAISMFMPDNIISQYFRKENKTVEYYVFDGILFPIKSSIDGIEKYTCSMLSFTWLLKRVCLGHTLTVLDMKYFNVESKAMKLLKHVDSLDETNYSENVNVLIL